MENETLTNAELTEQLMQSIDKFVRDTASDVIRGIKLVHYTDAKVTAIDSSGSDEETDCAVAGGTVTAVLDDGKTYLSGLKNATPFSIYTGNWIRIYYTGNIADGYVGYLY